MSKPKLSARVPKNIEDQIESYRDENGIDDTSEAMRQVLQRGLNSEPETPGEQLAESGTGVAVVGWIVVGLATALGQTWAVPLVVPFTGAVVVFSLFWASIRVLVGGALA